MGITLEHVFLLDLCKWFAGLAPAPENAFPNGWGSVFEKAHEQKLERIFALHIYQSKQNHRVSDRICEDLMRSADVRTRLMEDELVAVQNALKENGVVSLARKGVAFDRLVYGGVGLRTFSDNDLYIRNEDAANAHVALLDAGYVVGKPTAERPGFRALPREDRILYSLKPDHMPHYFKRVDAISANAACIDVAFDIAWYGSRYSSFCKEILQEGFDDITMLGRVRTIPIAMHFVSCIVHIFREGYFERSLLGGGDYNLRKFLDALLLWKALEGDQRIRVKEWLVGTPLEEVAFWSLHHVDDLFGTELVNEIGLGSGDGIHLNGWVSNAGELQVWRQTMAELIFQGSWLENDYAKQDKLEDSGLN